MLEIFDTHAHYMDEAYDEDRETLLSGMKEAGVTRILNVGYDIPSSKSAVEMAADFSFCYAAVGIHPHDAKSIKENDYDILREMAKAPKTVAIGEIGLDYHYDLSERDVQRERFFEQLNLARELDMPVVIHSREATKDTIDIINTGENRGVFHCFSGSVETAKIVLNKGYYISFGGSLTFKNADKLSEVAKFVPEDMFITETDCPYLSPVPLRGKRNISTNITYVIDKLATLRNKSREEIAFKAYSNADRLFGIRD